RDWSSDVCSSDLGTKISYPGRKPLAPFCCIEALPIGRAHETLSLGDQIRIVSRKNDVVNELVIFIDASAVPFGGEHPPSEPAIVPKIIVYVLCSFFCILPVPSIVVDPRQHPVDCYKVQPVHTKVETQ